MPAAHVLGGIDTGHGCWPSRPNAGASPNVFVNGIALHRQGDPWAPHTCPEIPETHSGVLGGGSSTVFINGKGAARVGDAVSCGGAAVTASPDVFIGG